MGEEHRHYWWPPLVLGGCCCCRCLPTVIGGSPFHHWFLVIIESLSLLVAVPCSGGSPLLLASSLLVAAPCLTVQPVLSLSVVLPRYCQCLKVQSYGPGKKKSKSNPTGLSVAVSFFGSQSCCRLPHFENIQKLIKDWSQSIATGLFTVYSMYYKVETT